MALQSSSSSQTRLQNVYGSKASRFLIVDSCWKGEVVGNRHGDIVVVKRILNGKDISVSATSFTFLPFLTLVIMLPRVQIDVASRHQG